MRESGRIDLSKHLREYPRPILVLRGTAPDAVLASDRAAATWKSVPKANVETIDSGHEVFEHPVGQKTCAGFVAQLDTATVLDVDPDLDRIGAGSASDDSAGSRQSRTKEVVPPTEAEPIEAEPTEAEPTEAEPTEAEPTEAEPTEAELIEAELIEAEPTQSSPSAESTPPVERAETTTTTPLAAPAASPLAGEQEAALIPRKVLFGNPEKTGARISPDGSKLAYIAPVDGVLNVWVAPVNDLDSARVITRDTHRGIRSYFWAYTNRHILYTQDKDGDEDWHLYAVNLDNGELRDLTPFEQVSARVQELSHRFPETILVGINDRGERQLHDIYRVNILTGERELVQENPGFFGFMTDDQYRVRLAVTINPDAEQLLLQPDEKAKGGWSELIRIGPEDAMTSSPVGFDSADRLYFLDSRDRNTAALTMIDMDSGQRVVIAENDWADMDDVITHPTERTVQAVSFTFERTEWMVLDEAIRDDFAYLETIEDGGVQLTSRTLDDKVWTVMYCVDNGPNKVYLYERYAKQATLLYTSNPSLENLPLVRMHSEVITSRDGLPLVSYLSLPKESDTAVTGRPAKPLPMVLKVHGGPWARDWWGYDPEHQLLANRGYAVLSVNFRGSTGFGKKFINLANQQWAAKMHEDLVDAVQWAIDQKIAQPDKIGIMGGSYGGYAALVGLTFTPELFACGVSIVGPSNLVTLLNYPPPYWMPYMPMITTRVADPLTEEGRAYLESRSPLFFVDRIQRPLLIGQGKQDPRVKQAESDQIVEAMEERKIPVTYVLFLEEGHVFVKPENRFAFYAITEAYLAEHLGGLCEEVGDAFQGAVFEVPSGAEQVPGLSVALEHHTPVLRAGGADATTE